MDRNTPRSGVRKETDMRIACLGDSNTYGYDPHSPFGGRYPYEFRWTGRLENEGIAVENHGCNGLPASRRSLHRIFAQQLQKEGRFDFVTVMLGTNDILLGASAEEAAEDVGHLINVLKELLCTAPADGSGAASSDGDPAVPPRLLLIAPPVLTRGFWVESDEQIETSRALVTALRAVAGQQGILFADASSWGIPLAYDGVHFTEEGHRIFAEKMLELLKGLPAQ